jgi:hypothetical protein
MVGIIEPVVGRPSSVIGKILGVIYSLDLLRGRADDRRLGMPKAQ